MTLIKSISGIRGTIGGKPGDSLSPIDIVKFAAAYTERLRIANPDKKRLTVVVGRDGRISGEMVESVLCGTLLSCGVDVINAGMASTPTVEMAVKFAKADGGIILTASHNPAQWNALKLLDSNGEFLSALEGAKLLECAEREDFTFSEVFDLGKMSNHDYTDEHIEAVLAHPMVDIDSIYRAGFKVVLDSVNSVGGIVMPRLFKALGVTCVTINGVPDGHFSHNPEPLPEHLTDLSARVVLESADLGVAVDPDVDRLALICEDGTPYGEEYTLVTVADYILSITPGATVSNLSSSRALRDVTESYGEKYFSSAVGEVNVVTKMKEVNAVIGGEGNGGVIVPALHYGRDALIGIALFLSHLSKKRMKVSELRREYPDYFISKNKIELSDQKMIDRALQLVKEHYINEKIIDIDGVKVDFEGDRKWVHLRKSNTEPVIRIYAEAPLQDEAEALIDSVKSLISKK